LDGSGENGGKDKDGELIAEEGKGTGTVGLKVYLLYFVQAVGGRYSSVVSLLALSVITQIATLVFEWWLSKWSDDWAAAEAKEAKDGSKSKGMSQQEQNL
jgi:hypothetical protein